MTLKKTLILSLLSLTATPLCSNELAITPNEPEITTQAETSSRSLPKKSAKKPRPEKTQKMNKKAKKKSAEWAIVRRAREFFNWLSSSTPTATEIKRAEKAAKQKSKTNKKTKQKGGKSQTTTEPTTQAEPTDLSFAASAPGA